MVAVQPEVRTFALGLREHPDLKDYYETSGEDTVREVIGYSKWQQGS